MADEGMKYNVQVTMSPELRQVLTMLQGQKLSKHPLIKKALNDGARYLMDQGKSRLKAGLDPTVTHTGNLLRAFTARVKRSREGALAGFTLVGGRGGKEARGYHAWLVDRGTSERETHQGYNRGRGGYGKHSHSSSLGFWTKTRESDGDEALLRVRDGIDRAFYAILG